MPPRHAAGDESVCDEPLGEFIESPRFSLFSDYFVEQLHDPVVGGGRLFFGRTLRVNTMRIRMPTNRRWPGG